MKSSLQGYLLLWADSILRVAVGVVVIIVFIMYRQVSSVGSVPKGGVEVHPNRCSNVVSFSTFRSYICVPVLARLKAIYDSINPEQE